MSYSSIYKVERRVDTVIIEMDSHVAEKLVAVLARVTDETRYDNMQDGLNDLFERLTAEEPVKFFDGRTVMHKMVRHPSPMYRVQNDGQNLRVVSGI